MAGRALGPANRLVAKDLVKAKGSERFNSCPSFSSEL